MDKKRIKIYTRSANIELYKYSQGLIDLPYKRKRLCGTTADGYIYQMLQDTDCDIAINIDEDAFVTDNRAVESLLQYVIEHDIVCCGMQDGGALPIRKGNPIVQNPFFNIINLKVIREQFGKEDIEQFSYDKHKQTLISQLPKDLQSYKGVEIGRYEPYYNFFFWLALHFKLLYLDVAEHKDGCTTIVYNQEHKQMLLHTWWSREFGKDEEHTPRIKAVIDEAYAAQGKKKPWMGCTKVRRWFEYKSQQFGEWWERWTKVGAGRWIIAHAKRSPKYYCKRIEEKVRGKIEE